MKPTEQAARLCQVLPGASAMASSLFSVLGGRLISSASFYFIFCSNDDFAILLVPRVQPGKHLAAGAVAPRAASIEMDHRREQMGQCTTHHLDQIAHRMPSTEYRQLDLRLVGRPGCIIGCRPRTSEAECLMPHVLSTCCNSASCGRLWMVSSGHLISNHPNVPGRGVASSIKTDVETPCFKINLGL